VSKYKFKITYRNENEYGQYWGDKRYTISIIAETLEQAKQKLDEIEKNGYKMHKNILEWEAEEITEEKGKEIERLKEKVKEWQDISTRINEDNNRLNNIINEAIEYIHWRLDNRQDMYITQMTELLEILDKENK